MNYHIAIYMLTNVLPKLYGYPTFNEQIPNGDKVINPCDKSATWQGVGHQTPSGGGIRNSFGAMFKENNAEWSVALCQFDSDGDGRTNGEELGDPNCVWEVGSEPERTLNITHPGICEPLTAAHCHVSNSWLQCAVTSHCSVFDQPDVRNASLRFPNTSIPEWTTNYFCKMFRLPSDQIYDVIGHKPVIDNSRLTHHMILFGCKSNVSFREDTWQCKMGLTVDGCNDPLVLWSVGVSEFCFPSQFAIRIGSAVSAYKTAVLQIHWNNYEQKKDFDSSGLLLFYTPKLRPNAGAILAVGQYDFFLPPRLKAITTSGYCSSNCSGTMLKNSINISISTFHMHSLGIRGSIQQFRNGKFIQDILTDQPYTYDSPPLNIFNQPIVFEPNDSIRVDCTYDTSELRNITTYGEGTNDEMCIGFISYYPAQEPVPFRECSSSNHLQICNDYVEYICDVDKATAMGHAVHSACASGCGVNCFKAIDEFKRTGCASDAAYQAISPSKSEVSSLYDLMDFCEILAVESCDWNRSVAIGKSVTAECTFDCASDCLELIGQFRSAGCVEAAWKFMLRKEATRKLAAYVMACEQFIVDRSDALRVELIVLSVGLMRLFL